MWGTDLRGARDSLRNMKTTLATIMGLAMPLLLACGSTAEQPDVTAESGGDVDSVSQADLDTGINAYAWVHQPFGEYIPNTTWTYNHRGLVRVAWTDVGRARVTFEGLPDTEGGNVQVVAFGTDNVRCKVESWWPLNGVSAFVFCHHPDGTPVSTRFVISFSNANGRGNGHLWWSDPQGSGRPSEHYASDDNFWVERVGTGLYDVTTPGLVSWGGNAHVTAYGSGPEYCNIQGWWNNGNDTTTRVACFDTAGVTADSMFSFRFLGYYLSTGRTLSYTWANDIFSTNYTPNTLYQDVGTCQPPTAPGPLVCNQGTDNRAGSLGGGKYWVSYKNSGNNPTTVLITAYGQNGYCKSAGWEVSPAGKAFVNCFSPSGAPMRSQFTNAFIAD